MEAVLFVGVQGSGKTTFCRERFFETHVRISRDMLRTRHRQSVILAACLAEKQPFVLDDTNVTKARRAELIAAARAAGFRVIGFYFRTSLGDAIRRNRDRPPERVVPAAGVAGTFKRLEPPAWEEGFDELHTVEIAPDGRFLVVAKISRRRSRSDRLRRKSSLTPRERSASAGSAERSRPHPAEPPPVRRRRRSHARAERRGAPGNGPGGPPAIRCALDRS